MNIPKNVKKIAILRANKLGDFIVSLPALASIRKKFSEAEISLLACSWTKDFLKNRPSPVDRVIVVPKSKGIREEKPYDSPQTLASFFKKMQQENFDIALQIHGGGKYSNTFVKNMGAKFTAGPATHDAEKLDLTFPYRLYQPEAMRLLEIAMKIGAPPYEVFSKISTTEKDKDELHAVFKSDKKYVVIHSGANDLERRWDPKKFAQVATHITRLGYDPVLTGSKSEEEYTKNIEKATQLKVTNLTGKLSLHALTALLASASLLISNDTGPLHLAGAVGTKTIGLFLMANYINWGVTSPSTQIPLFTPVVEFNEMAEGEHFFEKQYLRSPKGAINKIPVSQVIHACNAILKNAQVRLS